MKLSHQLYSLGAQPLVLLHLPLRSLSLLLLMLGATTIVSSCEISVFDDPEEWLSFIGGSSYLDNLNFIDTTSCTNNTDLRSHIAVNTPLHQQHQ